MLFHFRKRDKRLVGRKLVGNHEPIRLPGNPVMKKLRKKYFHCGEHLLL